MRQSEYNWEKAPQCRWGKEPMVMRQFWGYQNSVSCMQSSGEPSVFFAYSFYWEPAMQIPIPAKLLISESP